MTSTRVLHVEGITGCRTCPMCHFAAEKYCDHPKLINRRFINVEFAKDRNFPDWCPLPKQEEE